MSKTLTCDVLVVGSGAGGLAGALTAAVAGLDVIVIEKDMRFGGTTAHSEGMIWIPMNRQSLAQGKTDAPADALRYLEAVAGNHLDRAKSMVYVETAARMLAFLERESRVRYALAGSLDYHAELPGATAGTRSLRVEPMDGRTLGPVFDMIRPPLKSTLALGGMTLTGVDLPDALKAHRSLRSFAYMAWLAGSPRGSRAHQVAATLEAAAALSLFTA